MPSASFRELIDGFGEYFKALHGDELNYEKRKVLTVLQTTIMEAYPNTPKKIIKTYVSGRLHLRIKFLNHRRKEIAAEEKRKKWAQKKEEARKAQEDAASGDAANAGAEPAAGSVAGPPGAAGAPQPEPPVAGPSGAPRPYLPPTAARRNQVKTKQFRKK